MAGGVVSVVLVAVSLVPRDDPETKLLRALADYEVTAPERTQLTTGFAPFTARTTKRWKRGADITREVDALRKRLPSSEWQETKLSNGAGFVRRHSPKLRELGSNYRWLAWSQRMTPARLWSVRLLGRENGVFADVVTTESR